MSVSTVTLFFALLAVAAQAAVVVGVVALASPRWRPAVVHAVGPSALGLAFGVALVAMAGSLYLSEVANFPPCRLCWYQRIAMYPLVPVLGLAAWRRDEGIAPYGILLAVLGGLISIYHVIVERFPNLESGACDPTNPCSIIWVERFGYLTIPTMALSAFALIAVLLGIAHAWARAEGDR